MCSLGVLMWVGEISPTEDDRVDDIPLVVGTSRCPLFVKKDK